MVDGLYLVEDRHMSLKQHTQPSLKQNDEKIICTIKDVSCTIFLNAPVKTAVQTFWLGVAWYV